MTKMMKLVLFSTLSTLSSGSLSSSQYNNYPDQIPLSSGQNFTDWDGLQICYPTSIIDCPSEESIVSTVVSARTRKVKVVGAGHSFSPIAMTDDSVSGEETVLIKLYDYAGIVVVDKEKMTAEVKSGTRLR